MFVIKFLVWGGVGSIELGNFVLVLWCGGFCGEGELGRFFRG